MPHTARRRASRAALVAALAAAALAAPQAAMGAGASVSGSTLSFLAAPGEPNDVTVERRSTTFRVTDAGAPVRPGTGCSAVTAYQVTCPIGSVTLLKLTLGDQDDRALVLGTTAAQVSGGSGTDDLTGGSGPDRLDAGAGDRTDDRLQGRAGADTLIAAATDGRVLLSGGDGDDTLTGSPRPAGYPVPAGTTTEYRRFLGGAGRDVIVGSGAPDELDGGTGPDDIDGGPGGGDFAMYAVRTEPLAIDLSDSGPEGDDDGGASDAAAPGGRRDLLVRVEGVVAGSGTDVLTGSEGDDLLHGGAGADELAGGPGADILCGDGGLVYAGYMRTHCEGTGDDDLDGGEGDDVLVGAEGADRLAGGAGFDFAGWNDATGAVKVTIADACPAVCAKANDGLVDTNPGQTGNQPEGDTAGLDVEGLLGGYGNDVLTGSAAANTIIGGQGSDALAGGAGNDELCGDQERRLFNPEPYGKYDCSEVSLSASGIPPSPSATYADALDGGTGDDVLRGGYGPDKLTGGTGADTADYAPREVELAVTIAEPTGCATPPCAKANDGAVDVAPATAGAQPEGDLVALDVENVAGGYRADTLSGSAAANLLSGSSGADTLAGMAGNDLLDPGTGQGDVMKGGSGFDYASYRYSFEGYGVTADSDGQPDDGAYYDVHNVHPDVEGIIGSAGTDHLAGPSATPVANTLVGNGGDDELTGHGGDDSLSGGGGLDKLFGGAGNDLLSSADGGSDTDDCGTGTLDKVIFDAPSPGVTDTLIGCEASGQTAVPASRAGIADPLGPEFAAMEARAARHHRLTQAR